MTATNVHLVQVGDSAIARGHGYIPELDVHIVFCLEEFAPVDLAAGNFDGDYMALGFPLVLSFHFATRWLDEGLRGGDELTCASLRSLMGMPMVDVMFSVFLILCC